MGNVVFQALQADISEMVNIGKHLGHLLYAQCIHLSTKVGTDLILSLAGPDITVEYSKWSPELQPTSMIHMPRVMVCALPKRTSAKGVSAYTSLFFY